MPCEICGSNDADHDDQFLLCDNCNCGFHIFCLEPKLKKIPEGAWFCPSCVKKDKAKKEADEKEKKKQESEKKVEHTKVSSVTLQKILNMDRAKKGKRKGRPRKIKEDPLEEELADYNEWYNL